MASYGVDGGRESPMNSTTEENSQMKVIRILIAGLALAAAYSVASASDDTTTKAIQSIATSVEVCAGQQYDTAKLTVKDTLTKDCLVTNWPITTHLFGNTLHTILVEYATGQNASTDTHAGEDWKKNLLMRCPTFYFSSELNTLLKFESSRAISNISLPADPWEDLYQNALNGMWDFISLLDHLPSISLDSALSMVQQWESSYVINAYYVIVEWPPDLEPDPLSTIPGSGEEFWIVLLKGFGDDIERYGVSEEIPSSGMPYVRYQIIRANGKKGNRVTMSRYPGL